jgi:small-conductance mechanosensitive channel
LWQPGRLEIGSAREHIGGMILNALKIAALIVLVVVTLGVVPDRKWGAVFAFAACVAAAFVLHFVAP